MQIFNLDLSRKRIPELLFAKQRDVGTKIRINITDNGVAYVIPANVTFSVWFSGKSGSGNYTAINHRSAFEVADNSVTVELIMQMLNMPGEHLMCLIMNREDGAQLGLWNIPYYVEAIPGADSVGAKQYYQAFLMAQQHAENAAQMAENAARTAIDVAHAIQVPVDSICFNIDNKGILSIKEEYKYRLPHHVVLPDSIGGIKVTGLSDAMFSGNNTIESVTLPSSITIIPERCFQRTYNLKYVRNTANIKDIGDSAFAFCGIKEAKFPSLNNLEDTAFQGCPNLVNIDIGKSIQRIPFACFANCWKLYRVTGGASVITIEESAFKGTPELTDVEFITDNLTDIKAGAFIASGLRCDWSALKQKLGDKIEEYAYMAQPNGSDDFWTDLRKTIKSHENPLPTLLAQQDNRWRNKPILSADSKELYGNGCLYMAFLHSYCGLHKLDVETVDEFEDILKATAVAKFAPYTNEGYGWVIDTAQKVGLKVERYDEFNTDNLAALYDGLYHGKYAILLTGSPPHFTGHAVVAYGVRADGKILIADSNFNENWEDSARKYAVPYESFCHPNAFHTGYKCGQFLLLSLDSASIYNGEASASVDSKTQIYNGEVE